MLSHIGISFGRITQEGFILSFITQSKRQLKLSAIFFSEAFDQRGDFPPVYLIIFSCYVLQFGLSPQV